MEVEHLRGFVGGMLLGRLVGYTYASMMAGVALSCHCLDRIPCKGSAVLVLGYTYMH